MTDDRAVIVSALDHRDWECFICENPAVLQTTMRDRADNPYPWCAPHGADLAEVLKHYGHRVDITERATELIDVWEWDQQCEP